MPQFVGNEMRPWGLECHIDPQDGVNAESCREQDTALWHTVRAATPAMPAHRYATSDHPRMASNI